MGVRIPPPLPGFSGTRAAGLVKGKRNMATRAVKMSSEESPGGSGFELGKKVTGSIDNTREFLHDVRVEVKQVTWPSREDVMSTTAVVIVTVAFFGVFLAIVEKIAQLGLDWLLKYFHA